MVTSLWKYLEEVGGEATDPPSGVRRKTIHKHMSSLVQVLFNSLLIQTEIHGPSGYIVFFRLPFHYRSTLPVLHKRICVLIRQTVKLLMSPGVSQGKLLKIT